MAKEIQKDFNLLKNGERYLSATCYQKFLDLVLFYEFPVDKRGDDELAVMLRNEYERITLAHELGHSAMLQPIKLQIIKDQKGIRRETVISHSFGKFTDLQRNEDPNNRFLGSIFCEGQAVLVAKDIYNDSERGIWAPIFNGEYEVGLDNWMVSAVPNHPKDQVAYDGNVLALMILSEYDEKYSGIFDAIYQLSDREITLEEFITIMENKERGLYNKLQIPHYEREWLAVAKELNIVRPTE